MTASETCPSDAVLADLVAGRLEPRAADQYTKHIDHCDRCQQRLLTQTSLPNIEVQLPRMSAGTGDSSHLKEAIKRAKEMRDSSPPQQPGESPNTDSLDAEVSAAFARDGFDLFRVIGRGGMGVVYLAREQSLNRTVAVKVLSPMLACDSSARQRFLREARSAAAVVHPNVITLHAVSDKPPLPYLVMEYIEGVSLQQQLDRGGVISIDNVTRIGRQLCAALAAAHAKGVVHRDIKPGNIMLNAATGKVLLGDFGLATAAQNSRLTRTGTIVGTPAFVAPETLASVNAADFRSDLFSLGAVLYALCSGDSPFQSDSLMGTLHNVSSANPERLSDCAPHVPEWLSDVVMRLLEKDPNDRYQTATEVRSDLARIPAGAQAATSVPDADSVQRQPDSPSIVIQTSDSSPTRNNTGGDSNRLIKHVAVGVLGLLVIALGVYAIVNNVKKPGFAASSMKSSNDTEAGRASTESSVRPRERTVEHIQQDAFILLDEASDEIGRYRSLDEAIEHAVPGATIQIRSNESFEFEDPIELNDVSVVALEGYSPAFQFRPRIDDESDDEVLEAMLRVEGSVSLVDLDLRLAGSDEEAYALIEVSENGSLQLTHCKLLVEEAGYCVASESNAQIGVEHCRLHAPQSIAIGLCDDDGGSLKIEQSWITGEIAFESADFLWHKLIVNECKLVCSLVFHIESEAIEEDVEPWIVRMDNTILYAIESLIEAELSPANQQSATCPVNIVGENNTFSGHLFSSSESQKQRQWQEELTSHESRYIDNPFDVSYEEIDDSIHMTAFPYIRIKDVLESDDEESR